MRKEPFVVGDYVHVIKRGARGGLIVKDEEDKFRFLLMLAHFNDENFSRDWLRDISFEGIHLTLKRASRWEKKRPLVKIIAYTLLPNHFHLILKEINDGGISKFMNRLGKGMTQYMNTKNGDRGTLFQGAYVAKNIRKDEYFRYVLSYVMAKNVFELFPKGFKYAIRNFEEAWKWAIHYKYSSLGEYMEEGDISAIIDKDIAGEIFGSKENFKKACYEGVLGSLKTREMGDLRNLE